MSSYNLRVAPGSIFLAHDISTVEFDLLLFISLVSLMSSGPGTLALSRQKADR